MATVTSYDTAHGKRWRVRYARPDGRLWTNAGSHQKGRRRVGCGEHRLHQHPDLGRPGMREAHRRRRNGWPAKHTSNGPRANPSTPRGGCGSNPAGDRSRSATSGHHRYGVAIRADEDREEGRRHTRAARREVASSTPTRCCRRSLGDAVRDRMLAANPCDGMDLPARQKRKA